MKTIYTLVFLLFSIGALQAQNAASAADMRSKDTAPQKFGLVVDNLSVYPNPASDYVKLSFHSGRDAVAEVSIINNIGSTVLNFEKSIEQGANSIEIDLEKAQVGKGIYFLMVKTGDQRITRKLIIK